MSSLIIVNHYAVRGKSEKMAGFNNGVTGIGLSFFKFIMYLKWLNPEL
jgi:hypothetical protein